MDTRIIPSIFHPRIRAQNFPNPLDRSPCRIAKRNFRGLLSEKPRGKWKVIPAKIAPNYTFFSKAKSLCAGKQKVAIKGLYGGCGFLREEIWENVCGSLRFYGAPPFACISLRMLEYAGIDWISRCSKTFTDPLELLNSKHLFYWEICSDGTRTWAMDRHKVVTHNF